MPQSLAKIYVHLVFSTKNRETWLREELRGDLLAYMGGTLNGMGCLPVEINAELDHVHALILLGRTVAMSDVVAGLKRGSTEWLRRRSAHFATFHWQSGYGVFSVSESSVEAVREYIRNQHEHHRGKTFQEEYRAMLAKHGIEFDERYVWD
jgi:REP element-mobilizing transposase RayT